jgi:multidrug efflux pump subunit AcrA (membrane-fusion protein)
MTWLKTIGEKRWLVLVLGLVIIAGGVGAYFVFRPSPDVETQEPQMQTATVRQGDLEVRASGSGVLIAMDPVTLGFGAAGPVAELHVTAGDDVNAGDVLAIQGEQEELEAAVASTQLTVLEAQDALDSLYENADLVTAQAQFDLAEAMDGLEDAEYDWTVAQPGNRASQTTLDAAAAELALAEDSLDNAKQQLSQDPDNDMKKLNVAEAEQRYNSALWAWNWYTGEPTNIQQDLLDAQLAIAQAKVAEAERAYAKVADGPDPDGIAKAELQLENAIASWDDAKSNLEKAVIVAPIGGTILEVEASVGDSVTGGFITMADLSQPHLEIYLDETDLDKIDLDYEVEVVFDALPDSIFYGHVIQLDPSLYQSQNVSTIKGLVQLDDESAMQVAALPLGVNASVDVIAGQAEGAILVPVEALRQIGPDEYTVFVVQGEELELRPVQVSLIDITFAAVADGLQPGEVVSTGIVEAE